MTMPSLLTPTQPTVLMVDQQAGLAFEVGSIDRQALLGNVIALAKTTRAVNLPIVVSTSASAVYSGPLMPAVQEFLPGVASLERHSMNAWEDAAVRAAVENTGRKKLLVSGLLTEACVSFTVLSALADGYDVSVVADACGGVTNDGHSLALRRMEAAGATMTSWLQVLLELQRDWTRKETYADARAIVEARAGGYGIGLAYARDMIHPVKSTG
ncbi:hydrolase [Rhizobium sp. ZK1]|uniref:hydrolase n=1 Tax=Rhizobium sp. ZK1 TaxID=3389872 RepID=UPI0039F681C4